MPSPQRRAVRVGKDDIIPAASGKQALDYLSLDRAPPPELVILELPLVSGWQVIERIHRDAEIAAVPVVVITAATRDRPTGASALFRKPLQMQALHSAERPRARSTGTALQLERVQTNSSTRHHPDADCPESPATAGFPRQPRR
jgi:DNA-binding response OmpR family regulator